MKKKIMAALLACALAAGTAASPVGMVTVRAEDGAVKESGGFQYAEVGDGIEITKYTGSATEVNIPEMIDGKTVTGIGEFAFMDCSGLTSIHIPEGVTSIGEWAFRGCGGLTSIHIPEGVTSIGNCAFDGCSGLTSIHIPEGVTSIGERAFSGCSGLTSITVDADNPEYDSRENCNAIIETASDTLVSGCKNTIIPGNVTSIGECAFSGCSGLTSIHIPEGVTSIGEYAFSGCSGLTSVSITTGVTCIGAGAFDDCGLKDIYYGGSQKQWDEINIEWYDIEENEEGEYYETTNEILKSVNIYCNSGQAGGPSGPQPGTSDLEQKPEKKNQSITATDITKTYGAKPFSLGAKSSGGAALSYVASNPKVATVDVTGKVTIKGCGVTDITITAAETSAYAKAQKVIKLTVKPKKMTVSSVKSKKKKTATVKWKKDKTASGYLVECATDKKFKKNKVKVTVSKNKTVSTTVKKLKAGKKYYVRVCAYAKSGKAKVQGDWSKAKTVKVKK